MSGEDDQLPREKLEVERLRYQWYVDYDRENEYEKAPGWSDAVREKNVSTDGEYRSDETRFYNRFEPEHKWIRSDTTYDLTQTL